MKIMIKKKILFSRLMFLVILIGAIPMQNPTNIQAASKKKSYITNKNFKGSFEYEGQKKNWRKGWYSVIIYKITKNGKIRFNLDKGGRNASPLYATGVLTSRIKGNKAKFTYKGDGWGNKGKGTIVFNKNGTIYLTVKETYTAVGNRSSLQISKTVFKKVKRNRK